jgi:membrane protein DedA with SNARE-associated domain
MESLVITYGYLGILLGTILEGEATVVLAGILCQQGIFDYFSVVFVALIGTLIGDQTFYYLARWKGYEWASKSPQFRRNYPRASELLGKHATWIVLMSRFLYGLRMVIPATCGVMRIPAWRYSLLNLGSALLWTPLMAWLGYAFGKSVHAFLNGIYHQLAIFGPLVVLSLLIWFFGLKGLRGEICVLRLHLHLPHAVPRWRDLGIGTHARDAAMKIRLARSDESGP